MQTLDEALESLRRLTIDLTKESFEYLGYDMGPTKNEIDYYNYLVNDPIVFSDGDLMGNGWDDGTGGLSPQITSGQTKANALQVISMLVSDLGLTREQAAGIAGVMTAESGVNPAIFNKGERAGTYKSSGANNEGTPYGTKHSPWSYGAGICQWTYCDRKEKAIMGGLKVSREQAINIIKTKGIEGLSLENQVKMLEYELQTTYKNTLAGIKKCVSATQSAATFYCHAVAGYSTSTDPATQSEVNKKNMAYAKVGATSQINKGMSFAQGYIT